MERMTKREKIGERTVAIVTSDHCFDIWSVPEKYTGEAIERLAAYEDTGLEPEDIKTVQENLKPIPFARYREIMEAERDSRAVVLPCKVGDTIYVIPSEENFALNLVNRHEENNRIYEQRVHEVRFFRSGYLLTTCDGLCSVLDEFFGENWFLSRKEAEKKMKELEKKNEHLTQKAAGLIKGGLK